MQVRKRNHAIKPNTPIDFLSNIIFDKNLFASMIFDLETLDAFK